jgi:hypothetical protein
MGSVPVPEAAEILLTRCHGQIDGWIECATKIDFKIAKSV